MIKSYYLHTKELMDATDNGSASVVLYSDYLIERIARLEAESKIKVLEARLVERKKQVDQWVNECAILERSSCDLAKKRIAQHDFLINAITEESLK